MVRTFARPARRTEDLRHHGTGAADRHHRVGGGPRRAGCARQDDRGQTPKKKGAPVRRQLWGPALVLALITSAASLTSAGAAEEREPRPLRELYDNRAVSEDG
ncbi:hypothetical protein ACFQVA_35780 [Actinomadura keratinilytica]